MDSVMTIAWIWLQPLALDIHIHALDLGLDSLSDLVMTDFQRIVSRPDSVHKDILIWHFGTSRVVNFNRVRG